MGSTSAGLLEAAYTLGGTTEEWLDRALCELRRYVGVSTGNAYFYDMDRERASLTCEAPIFHGAVGQSFFDASHAAMPPQAILHLFERSTRSSRLSTEVPVLFETDPFIRHDFPKAGVADMLAIQVSQAVGPVDVTTDGRSRVRGCMVTIYLPARERGGARTKRELDVIARHFHAGLSLRGGDTGIRPTTLSRASASEAAAIWRGVLEGRWIVVHSDDIGEASSRDGRERRLVARPCDLGSPQAISPEERHVLELAARGIAGKEIAIELGVVESIVSKLLRRGMKKLGARTRAELAALVRLAR